MSELSTQTSPIQNRPSIEEVFYLNPDYHFKNDVDRIVMYSLQEVAPYSSAEWISYIHPAQAQILTLFTEGKTWGENINTLAESFHLPFDQAEEIVRPYIRNEASFFTETLGEKVFFPKQVLIDEDTFRQQQTGYDFSKEDLTLTQSPVNLKNDRMHRAPQSLIFMVNNRCVTQCKYCYADKHTCCQEMSTEQILRFIDEAHRLKMSYIDVIGGEFFLKKDWDILLRNLVEKRLTPTYISTKIPLSEEDVRRLKDTGYNHIVQISLDTLDYDKSRQIIHSWPSYIEELKRGFDYLQQYGFTLYVDTILTRHNTTEEDMQALFGYLKTVQGLSRWEIRVPEYSIYHSRTFSEIKPSKEEAARICNYVRESIQPVSPFLILVSDDALKNPFRQGQCNDPYFEGGQCSVLQNKCFVLPDGKVTLCERLYWHPQFIIGDLTTQSIEEMWQSERAKSLFSLKQADFRDKSICKNCHNFYFCNENHRRCWVRVIKAYGTENWDFPDPHCCYAPPIQTDMMYQ